MQKARESSGDRKKKRKRMGKAEAAKGSSSAKAKNGTKRLKADSEAKKSTNRGKYRSYDRARLNEAYTAVCEDGLPIQKAAKMFGIPVTTLKDRVRGRIDVDIIKSGPPPLFSEEQESYLAEYLGTMSDFGYGYTRNEILNLATDYSIHLGLREETNPLSMQWLYKFLARWPSLREKKSKHSNLSLKNPRPLIMKYFGELEKLMETHGFEDRPQAVFSIDEKVLSANSKKLDRGKTFSPSGDSDEKPRTFTIIGGGNAQGTQIPPFFIFRRREMTEDLLEGATPGTAGTISQTGESSSAIFASYIQEHLVSYLPERDENDPVLILYDGRRNYMSIELIEWAKENHIIFFVLPPHCSLLPQPLDVSCFSHIEDTWNSACHNYLKKAGRKSLQRFDICQIGCAVYDLSLSASNILHAFRRCGIYPVDKTKILDSDKCSPSPPPSPVILHEAAQLTHFTLTEEPGPSTVEECEHPPIPIKEEIVESM